MNRDFMVDINLKTRIWVDDTVDKEWLDGLVEELVNEAEDEFDMGFNGSWNFRKEEEVEE